MRRLILFILIAMVSCNVAYGGFGGYLQANTAVDLMVGPFIDDTDGKTAETGLTITEAEVFLSKNGGNHADKSEATSLSHKGIGNYLCKLDATDTNTEGILTLMIHESGALAIKVEYMVLAQAAYISLVTAKDSGYMDVDVKVIETADATDTINASCDTAIETYALDHLITAACDSGPALIDHVVDNSILAFMLDDAGDISAYDDAKHSLVAIGDDTDTIIADTDDIGIAGAGLTAINLPNQTMDIVGNITGNLSGSVGTLTGGVDLVKIHGSAITETTSGMFAANWDTFFDNADSATAKTLDDVGGASGGGSILAVGAGNLGDYKEDAAVYFIWRTIDRSGAADTPSTAGTIAVYKNNGTAQVTTPTGITDTRSFDSGDTTAGVHLIVIDTSANSFYAVGQDYSVVLYGAVIDTKTVTSVIATFSIEKRFTEEFWDYEG